MKTIYKCVFEPEEDGGYSVSVPSLPGCFSQGDSYQEALENIKEAIAGWVEVTRECGDEIPKPDALVELVSVEI